MGNVVWFEVMGGDNRALQAFYGSLFGWKFEAAPGVGDYGIVHTDEGIPSGVGQAPMGPGWTTFYVQVDDIEATLAQAEERGAKRLMPPTQLPDGATISVVADPEGHPVGLFQRPAA